MKTKPWLCKNGHVLGMIQWNGDGTPQLALYRHAVDLVVDDPAEVDVLGPVVGRIPVRCDQCDSVQLWDISVEALVDLFEGLDDRQVLDFSKRLLERNEP